MASLLISRATLIWIILVVATGMAWGMGHGIGGTDVAGVVIFGISFMKVRLVIREFMEIRGGPVFMRVASDLWLIVICTTLTGLFLSAPS